MGLVELQTGFFWAPRDWWDCAEGQAKHWPDLVLSPTSWVSWSEAGEHGLLSGAGTWTQGSWTCHSAALEQLASAEFCVCCLSQSLNTQSTELTHRPHRWYIVAHFEMRSWLTEILYIWICHTPSTTLSASQTWSPSFYCSSPQIGTTPYS